jgi:hypothetical protein
MAKANRNDMGLLILAGVGAGALLGAGIGMVLGRHIGRPSDPSNLQSVDELKEKTEQVLGELSENVTELVARSRVLLEETRARPRRTETRS